MTVNNQRAATPVHDSLPVRGSISSRNSPATDSWSGRNDAVQLSRLGGVLNVLATDASSSLNRIERLQAAVRERQYSVSGLVLGRKLMSEMFVNR
jgi:hypothetical protein